jgi:hypothetical protein
MTAVGCIDGDATLAAVPDAVAGQRLLGQTADCAAMKTALAASGVNPLVAAAFRSVR